MSLLDDERIRDLVREVEEARALIGSGGDPSGEVNEALDSVYRDLGRHVHALIQKAEAPGPAPLPLVDAEFESDGWYTDEASDEASPLFSEGDFGETHETTDIPESDAITMSTPRPAEMDDLDLMDLSTLRADATDPDGELHRYREGRDPSWAAELITFVELLAPPGDLLAASSMPEEASKVQWAAGVVDKRLTGWPTTIQVAILGMLAARALNLAAHLDVEVGPRRALDRLKRYRAAQDLPYPAGLMPGPHPETDTWAEDALSFWHLLRPPV